MFRRLGPVIALLLASPALAETPADPFDDLYELSLPVERGVAAGQVRFMGMGGGGIGEGLSMRLQGTYEQMTVSYVGVRFSSPLTIWTDGPDDPRPWAFTMGPSLHLFPHRRFDLGAYFEGGFVLVGRTSGPLVPIVSLGGTIDIWLNSFWFVHLESRGDWAHFSWAGVRRDELWWTGSLGLGLAL